jgi:hypothetical protein
MTYETGGHSLVDAMRAVVDADTVRLENRVDGGWRHMYSAPVTGIVSLDYRRTVAQPWLPVPAFGRRREAGSAGDAGHRWARRSDAASSNLLHLTADQVRTR